MPGLACSTSKALLKKQSSKALTGRSQEPLSSENSPGPVAPPGLDADGDGGSLTSPRNSSSAWGRALEPQRIPKPLGWAPEGVLGSVSGTQFTYRVTSFPRQLSLTSCPQLDPQPNPLQGQVPWPLVACVIPRMSHPWSASPMTHGHLPNQATPGLKERDSVT